MYSTSVGYAAGTTPKPAYEEVRSGQYRSGVYVCDAEQRAAVEKSLGAYQESLSKAGFGKITTEVLEAPEFYYAEDYHQQ